MDANTKDKVLYRFCSIPTRPILSNSLLDLAKIQSLGNINVH